MALSKKQIALAHVAAKELGISEDDRHAIQEAVTGKRSLTRMDGRDFEDLMEHFASRGFTGYTARASRPPGAQLVWKARALWEDLDGIYYEPRYKWKAFREFLKKRFHIEHERFLLADPDRGIKVVEAIKAIKRRRGQRTDDRGRCGIEEGN